MQKTVKLMPLDTIVTDQGDNVVWIFNDTTALNSESFLRRYDLSDKIVNAFEDYMYDIQHEGTSFELVDELKSIIRRAQTQLEERGYTL